jgi:hypothetical protein
VVLRIEVVLAFAAALAGLRQPACGGEAQLSDHVLGPAAPVGGGRQPLLGAEHAAADVGRDMALEVGLAAEQPEAVLDLPDDAELAGGRGPEQLRGRRAVPGWNKRREQGGPNRGKDRYGDKTLHRRVMSIDRGLAPRMRRA